LVAAGPGDGDAGFLAVVDLLCVRVRETPEA
jgi:hypothetical protein